MKLIQFTALVMMGLLTMKLLILPKWAVSNYAMSRARWLMTIGTGLLGIQFMLQYMLGLRELGVTQAAMLNLALFLPCSWMMTLAVIFVQKGRITKMDKYIGLMAWAVVLALLFVAILIDGRPLLSDTPELRWAEIAGSACYLAMQGYYTWRHLTNLRGMRQTLANYYDYDMEGILNWMQLSIFTLAIMAMMVPLLIFISGPILAFFSLLFFVGIFYLVDSFCLYTVSSNAAKMMEAEQNEEEVEMEENSEEGNNSNINADNLLRVELAVKKWTDAGGHLRNGLKLPNAAEEMQIPRYLLSVWLKQSGRHYSEWINDLRIEEAKHVMREHPDWSNEAIAQHCGFSDRCYFQKRFKESTGMTPAQFLGSN
jgi:AraC-like DNA-binding protein